MKLRYKLTLWLFMLRPKTINEKWGEYMIKLAKGIDDYMPCRLYESFLEKDNEVEVATTTGAFRMDGVGRIVWLMLDGKHTIKNITDNLCIFFEVDESIRESMKEELVTVLEMLRKRDAVIVNWDPLHKLELCQELQVDE